VELSARIFLGGFSAGMEFSGGRGILRGKNFSRRNFCGGEGGGRRGILHERNFSRRNFQADGIFYGGKRQICQYYLKKDLKKNDFSV